MELSSGVLVCVTLQMTCGRLIAQGAAIAQAHGLPLYVIHAVHPGSALMGNPSESEALDYLYAQAARFGAEMTMIRCQDPLEAVVAQALRVNAAHVVLGVGTPQQDGRDFNTLIQMRLPQTQCHIVMA